MCAKPTFRDNRWIRQPGELVTAICLTDYPAILRSGRISVEPGAAAIFYHDDGRVSLHLDRRCKIPCFVTDIAIFSLDPFLLIYRYPHGQLSLELRFQGYGDDVAKFAQNLRVLLSQRLQLFTNDIQQMTQEFIRNWFLNAPDELTSPRQEYELIQYFEHYVLDARVVNYSTKAPTFTTCPGITPSQDASIGYFVFLSGIEPAPPKIIPLVDGEYLIGRASTYQAFEKRLLSLDRPFPPRIIWFPKEPGPSTIVRVAQIIVKNNLAHIYSGWPAHQSGETIEISHWDHPDKFALAQSKGYPLQGFERLFFSGTPQIELLYIPPMIDYPMVARDEILDYLELYGLWASAAYGWENAGNNERAFVGLNRALECSQVSCSTLIEQANILLSKCRVMRYLHAAPDEISNVQTQAYRLLNLPNFAVQVLGKVHIQEKPFRLTVFVHNLSKRKHAKNVSIFYGCEELGIVQRLDFGDLAPRYQTGRSFWIKSIYKAGKFPVRITMEFFSPEDDLYELWLTDFIEIIRRRPHVDVGGDSGVVSVQVEDQESIPDIHVGRDVGAVFIKLIKK